MQHRYSKNSLLLKLAKTLYVSNQVSRKAILINNKIGNVKIKNIKVAKYGLKSSCVLLNESFLLTEFFSEIPARSCQISKNYRKKIHKIYEIFLEL